MSLTDKEKRIMIELIQLYKEFPCLWDTREALYINKEARENAYEVLLEKYRELHEDATVNDVKKRLENMRGSFRREHKKVLLAKSEGRSQIPHLWYYEHLLFLNNVCHYYIDNAAMEQSDINLEFEESMPIKIEFEDEESSMSPTAKKRKASEPVSSIFLPEPHSTEFAYDEDGNSIQHENDDKTTTEAGRVTAAESFGKTVGLQLQGLDRMQRNVAEKLISDVIFLARLKKLTVNSNIES